MKNKLRVGIIYGGRSGEHAVSLASTRSILDAIDRDKFEVTEIGISKTGDWFVGSGLDISIWDAMRGAETKPLRRGTLLPYPEDDCLYAIEHSNQGAALHLLAKLDVVLPILHGTFGEDGTLQGLLEMADLAYVGAGVTGSAVAMDKGIFKDVMRANDIPVLESLLVTRGEIKEDPLGLVERAEKISGYPFFTKPANLGSSVGITKCRSRSDLFEGMMEASKFDRRVLIERGIANARELEVSVLGNNDPKASVPGEIIPAGDFYSYTSKYHDDDSQLLIPAPLSEAESDHIRNLAVRAYTAIDCAGMARVDFLLDTDSGELFMNEINTIPGFTNISMYPKLWEATGLPYSELITRLIELAIERKSDRDETVRDYDWR